MAVPIPVTVSKESLVVQFMQTAIIRFLNVDPTQTSIALMKYRDARWENYPHFQIVPSTPVPDGGGDGSQGGGSLIIRQKISVFLYVKNELDPYDQSGNILVNPEIGTLDLFKSLKDLFIMTYFGDVTSNIFLLTERMKFVSEGATQWEDQSVRLVSREFSWSVQYSEELPSQVTLTLSDVYPP